MTTGTKNAPYANDILGCSQHAFGNVATNAMTANDRCAFDQWLETWFARRSNKTFAGCHNTTRKY